MRILVLGAGVAGLSAALYLRRTGAEITVLDPLGPAGGASFGNAGLLSPDTAAPIAMPGMLRKVPGWLTDPLGPLRLRPRDLPASLPWLVRWMAAGRQARVLAISDGMRALHAPSLACWRELLGEAGYADFVRPTGQVYAWEGGGPGGLEARIRERHGIRGELLGEDDLRQMFPGLSRRVTSGLLLPDNAHTINPGRMVRGLADLLRAEGGVVLPERALKLIPRDGGGWMAMTNTANREADAVVVAGGAWSRQLLDPLGVRIPLQAERGYHAMLPSPSIELRLPISVKSRGFALTPMEGGLRAAGTVEIGSIEAPPDERRAAVLARHARELFPDLRHGTPVLWMGARPSTPDTLPVVGPAPGRPGLFLCVGHGHFGMTGGPPSGRLLAALVTGARPPIDPTPYAASRF
jgi:D-amino-acid dehydrogenase